MSRLSVSSSTTRMRILERFGCSGESADTAAALSHRHSWKRQRKSAAMTHGRRSSLPERRQYSDLLSDRQSQAKTAMTRRVDRLVDANVESGSKISGRNSAEIPIPVSAITIEQVRSSPQTSARNPTTDCCRIQLNRVAILQPFGLFELDVERQAEADDRGEHEWISKPPPQFRHEGEVHAVDSGDGRRHGKMAAQAASLRVSSFWDTDTSERWASSAVPSKSRTPSIMSLMRSV